MPTYEDLYDSFSWEGFCAEYLDWNPKEKFNIAHEAIDRHAANPEKKALLCIREGGQCEEITFGELKKLTAQFANLLRRLGIERGDRVARLLPRIPETYIDFLGTWKAGAVDVPLYTAFGPEAIAFRVKDSGAKLIVTDTENRKKLVKVEEELQGLQIMVVPDRKGRGVREGDLSFWEEMNQASDAFDPVACDQQEDAIIVYTSGTTGPPKGTLMPMSSLISVLPFARYCLEILPQEMFWGFADPGWTYGLLTAGTTALVLGNPLIVYEPRFTPEGWYETVEKYRVANFTAAPTVYRLIMAAGAELPKNYDLSSLKRLSAGGEALNPEVVVWFKKQFGIDLFDMYGITEVGMLVSNSPFLPMKVGSMGKPVLGFTIALVNQEGDPVRRGEVGLIACPRENPYFLSRSYLNQPEKYDAAFIKGRWFNTGDLARQDEDGYYYYLGRNDDVISSAGYRIGPVEVENVLIEHPAVVECAVVGKPDGLKGEVVKAFVVLKQDCLSTSSLQEEIQLFVKHRLSKHNYPREVEFIAELPKTPSGKIMRKVLQEKEYEKMGKRLTKSVDTLL